MNLTPIQQLEKDIMALEIELEPKSSEAFKKKYTKKLIELREKRKLMVEKSERRKWSQ